MQRPVSLKTPLDNATSSFRLRPFVSLGFPLIFARYNFLSVFFFLDGKSRQAIPPCFYTHLLKLRSCLTSPYNEVVNIFYNIVSIFHNIPEIFQEKYVLHINFRLRNFRLLIKQSKKKQIFLDIKLNLIGKLHFTRVS